MKKFKTFITSKKGIFIILFLFVLIGIIIRLSLIGKTDLWSDEAFTGVVLREDWRSMFAILIEDKVHPPIYYILLKLWCMAGGYSDIALRAFSLFFGTILIPLTFFFGKMLSKDFFKSTLIGLASAFFAAFSPYFFMYSVEARSYSMLMVFGAISAMLFYKAITTSPLKFNRLWLLTIIFIISTVLIHYLSIIHIFLYIIIYIFYRLLYRGTLSKRSFWIKLATGIVSLYILILIFFQTGFAIKLISQLQSRMGWIKDGSLIAPIKSVYAFLFGVDRQALGVPPPLNLSLPIQPIYVAIVLFILIAGSSIYYLYKNRNDKQKVFLISYLLIFSFGALFLVSSFTLFNIQLYVERYLSIFGWFLIILVSFLMINVWKRKSIIFLLIYIILIILIKLPPSNHTYLDTGKYLDGMNAQHIYTCTSYTMIIMSNYVDVYKDRLFLYAPNDYTVLSQSKLLNTAGVKKDFNDAVKGDMYICPERRDDLNRTFDKQIGDLMVYKLNKE